MKQLVLGNSNARLEEVPDPKAEPGWVVIRTKALPICGSDKGAFYFDGESRWGGHEGTGEVAEVAPASRFSPGDRVIIEPQGGCETCPLCRNGDYIYCPDSYPPTTHFAELVKKRENIIRLLPDDISFEVGSLGGCALSPGFSSLERLGAGAFDTVLVTGLGPVGLGAVTVAAFRGARVLAVEPQEFRRALAVELGAEEAFDPGQGDPVEWARERTGGKGVSVAVDCSGRAEAERVCIDAAAVLGRVAFAGENQGEIAVSPSRDFIRKGLTLIGTWHMNLLDWPKIVEIMRRKPEVEKIITHRFPFDEAQKAFETFFNGNAGKVLLIP
jgi:threonine dehydrogenase-like Zn-dependent dehydrogenase